jgi:HEAT repeat protein
MRKMNGHLVIPATALVLAAVIACTPGAGTAFALEAAEPDTAELETLTPEQLFLRAASSALQFEHMREPSRKVLVRKHEDSIPYLVTQLDTDGARERHALEDVLVRIGEPAVPAVIDALLTEAERTDTTRGARLAATVLGRIGDASAVDPLDSVHDHADWKVRGAIGSALGRIGTAGAIAPLVSLLSDENEMVRKSAAVGLRRVATAANDEEEPDREARKALDDEVVASLIGALGDRCYAVRYSSADALARIGEPALPALLEICEGGGGFARLMALRAAGGVGSTKALRTLDEALADEEWTVRSHAAMAMGAIGPDRSGRRSLERLAEGDPHPLVVAAAEEALASDG